MTSPSTTPVKSGPCEYLVGDVNRDGEVNIADVNDVLNVILSGNAPVSSPADVTDDGEVNIADVNMIINLILK